MSATRNAIKTLELATRFGLTNAKTGVKELPVIPGNRIEDK